ncbi:MAG: LCP family protein [Lachnospiraceae bacterium]|nr:LCP family protein [Lachnospiraceae bacterium]
MPRRGGYGDDPFADDGLLEEELYVKPRRKKKKRRIWLFILELFLLALLALGVFLFAKLGQIDHEKLDELIFNDGAKTTGYRNFVLYGVDSREGELTKDCHSDTIMIVSLNKATKEVRLCSVYRDTYLDNTNGEFRKATECYFFGGPQRSINMLNKNLDLDISDYVAVNFNAVVKVVDMLDGVDLEITDEEMELINGYCVENELVTGASYTPLTTSGYVHLTGTQALAYCRIRYTEGWDFKRTERQRTVLGLVYQKARQKGSSALVSIADAMLPEISTSMSATEILTLVKNITSFQIGEQTGFPFDQTPADLSDAGDCVVPVNLAANVIQLHQFLYGAVDYTPSATVQEISNQISSNTGIY